MSFDIKKLRGYGDGRLNDTSISDGLCDDFESYLRITGIDELDDAKVTCDFDNAIIGRAGEFTAGDEILIHVSAAVSETDYLGKYIVCKILLNQRGYLTLDTPITNLIPRDQFDFYNIQAVKALQFDCLHLKQGGAVAPQPFDPYNLIGGILFIKCYDTLNFEGGHISLTDRGIPANRKNLLRPITLQETAARGEGDVAKFSGQENFLTAETLLLNAGDGAVVISAKNIVCNENSRIGNVETFGAQFCRGAANSIGNKPANVTHIGGSTILICSDSIKNFDAKMIAKYRNSESYAGRGLARCLIAGNTPLTYDEGLYSYDILNNDNRLREELNVWDYGDGNFGNVTNPAKCINNYARVIGISQGGCRLTIDNETATGLAPIDEGALILVQVIQGERNVQLSETGKVITAKVFARHDNHLILDNPAPVVDLKNYTMQVISIPQFENFTLNENYTATPKYNGKVGGVCALSVSETCDLRGGLINVENKGGATAYGLDGLKYLGNAHNHNRLPLGEGNGSVFILAKTLTLNENSRIGASYNGLGGNTFGGSYADDIGGGYRGEGSGGSHKFGGASTQTHDNVKLGAKVGGVGSNGTGGLQGAHLLIIAEKINNFTVAALSSGGGGAVGAGNGGCGYGGAGNFYESGGSSGNCFIYCNS